MISPSQQLFPSEINYAQYRTSFFISLVNIYKAMGGGWLQEAFEGKKNLLPNG
jgi:multidrug efflux system outer membrane protein